MMGQRKWVGDGVGVGGNNLTVTALHSFNSNLHKYRQIWSAVSVSANGHLSQTQITSAESTHPTRHIVKGFTQRIKKLSANTNGSLGGSRRGICVERL